MNPITPISRLIAGSLLCLLASPLQADDTTTPDAPVSDVASISDAAPTEEPTRDIPVDQTILDEAIAEVLDRVNMPAPMELEYEAGVDPVVEAYDLGLIVEVTLEQVEAALAAAALTPETADDQAAAELKHRGSYRYFCGEITMEPPTPEEPPTAQPDPEPHAENESP